MNKEIIVIDGVHYYADRPHSCRGCFFWKNRKVGCTLKKENCYYLAESPKKKSPCAGCCYGPCVSFCKAASGLPIHSGSDQKSGPLCCLMRRPDAPTACRGASVRGVEQWPDTDKSNPPLQGNH